MKQKPNIPEYYFYHLLTTLSKSDVILRNGTEQFIGLHYDSSEVDAPCITCKEAATLSNCLYKYLGTAKIPCIDNSLVTRDLFENVEKGELLPTKYYSYVAIIYTNLEKIKKRKEKIFQIRLRDDIDFKINQLKRTIFNTALKRFRKNELKYLKNNSADVEKILEEGFAAIPDFKKMRFEKSYNESYQTVEYYLGTELRKYNIEFCFFIFVSRKDGLIYVCTPASIESLRIDEAEKVLNLVRELIKAIFKELISDSEIYCKEFEINLRLYEIAYTSMKTMLEKNYQKLGMEYGFKSDTTVVELYLRKKEDSDSVTTKNQKKSMFYIVISFNEFLRNPNAFKDFIKAPYKKRKWNFWCRERKYKPEFFEEKFQK